MDECPHCGERIPPRALACPHCGSDEETGWDPDADIRSIELPDDGIGDAEEPEEPPPEAWPRGRAALAVPGALLAAALVSKAAFPRQDAPFILLLGAACAAGLLLRAPPSSRRGPAPRP